MVRSYLMRRGGTFYFRRAVPLDLRLFFPCTEIWKSLRTRDRRSAQSRVRLFDSETDRLFTLIRSGALSRTEIDRVIKAYFRNLLDGFDSHRVEGSTRHGMAQADPGTILPEPSHSAPTLPLSDAITKYIEQQRTEGGRNETTLAEYEDACRLLEKLTGDMPISEVTRDVVRNYLKAIQQLPRHLNKNPKTRGKSIKEVIAVAKHHSLPTLSPSAIEKKFHRVKGLLKWAQHEELLERDVCVGINYRPPKSHDRREDEERSAYNHEDVIGFINGMREEEKKGTFIEHPERFWIPLIGLYSGLRLEEICQLHVANIRQQEGVWCFEVNDLDENGNQVKRLKTVNARRLVPIHSTLIEIGLLEYLENARSNRHPRLWGQLKKDSRGKYQRNIKDWYNGADNRPGFENLYISTAPSKSFHSLRHTFINELKQNMVDSRIIT